MAIALMFLLSGCASPASHDATRAGSASAATSAPVAAAPRKLPPMRFASNVDWYPSKAKQQLVTGRVLVGFKIDAHGKAVSLKVLKAEAPRTLRNAALDFVGDATFDVTDPAYDPRDPTPFAISVRFCIVDCGTLVGYPGYEDARISGSPVKPY
ncbi:MAG: TonB family protein [Proteobacteria bacterium]|nr:TonB family protein [Pseudomonadota bacterium]